jgi:uncharacterized YccA/Bax inhibitor family protein
MGLDEFLTKTGVKLLLIIQIILIVFKLCFYNTIFLPWILVLVPSIFIGILAIVILIVVFYEIFFNH